MPSRKPLFRKPVFLLALTSALSAAAPGALAQSAYEFKRWTPTLVVTAPSSAPQAPGSDGSGTFPGAPSGELASSELSLSAGDLSFGNRDVNAVSTMSLIVSNRGSSPLAFSGYPTVTGSSAFFAQTDCSSPIAADADCVVSVYFEPLTPDTHTASLSWAYAEGSKPLSATLSGVGRLPVTLSAVSPSQVSTLSSAVLTLTGSGFSDGTKPQVFVDSTEVAPSQVTVVSDSTLTVRIPAQSAGAHSLRVETSKGATTTLQNAVEAVAALGGTVTSIFQANGSRTLPATFGNCDTQGAVGHGTRSFLVQCMNRNYGGSLFKASWNGNTHEYSTLYTTGTMNPNGIGGVAVDPRGYVIAGQGNYNMTTSYRLSVLSASATSQSAPLNFYAYGSIAGASYAVSAILANPAVPNGYFAVLRSTAAGAKTLLKFTVSASGVVGDVQALGSRPSGAPTLPALGAAVVGADGKIYVGSSAFYNGAAQAIARLDPETGDVSLAYAATQGTATLGAGLAADAAGSLYFGTTSGVVVRALWNGTSYDSPQIIAGRESLPGSVDGPLGTNRLTPYTSVVASPGSGEVGLIEPAIGGGSSLYRVIR